MPIKTTFYVLERLVISLHFSLQSNPAITDTVGTREKVSVLQSVLIKRVNFKENVWSGSKKTVRNDECPY